MLDAAAPHNNAALVACQQRKHLFHAACSRSAFCATVKYEQAVLRHCFLQRLMRILFMLHHQVRPEKLKYIFFLRIVLQ
ncbi:hypothetical protein VU07_02850 [Desulfobulbus sp. F4]|nr:hypothetical protein [Desulfobulbus sp. F4]